MTTITRLTRFLQSFRRFYTGRFAGLAARSGLSMREIDVLLFLANHPGQDTAREIGRASCRDRVSAVV